MKIAFWSNVHGQTGVTSSLLALSVMTTIKKYKVALLQSHFTLNNMSMPLIGMDVLPEDFRDTGIDALLRDYKSQPLSEEIIKMDAITVPNLMQRCNLYIGTGRKNEEDYENELISEFGDIYGAVDQYHDFTFIDVRSGYSEMSQAIVEDADIAVVCLDQNKHIIERYFNNPLKAKNVYYLFGNYDECSCYNIKNLQRRYPALRKRCACIIHNTEYMDAMNDGKVVQYMLKNFDCSPESSNYSFINSIYSTLELLEIIGKEEL